MYLAFTPTEQLCAALSCSPVPIPLLQRDNIIFSPGLIPRLSINVGEKNRALYQMYVHELDIAAFIPSVTVRSMTNDVLQKMTYWEDIGQVC